MKKFKLKPEQETKITFFLPENIHKDFPVLKPFRIEKREIFTHPDSKIKCSGKDCPFCKAGIPKVKIITQQYKDFIL